MKQFFKYVLATITGIVLLSLLSFFIFAALLGSSLKSSFESTKVSINPNSILHLKLTLPLNDRPSQGDELLSSFLPVDVDGNYGLQPTIRAIETAKDDDQIRGIYLDVDAISIGFANLEGLEEALRDFKTSGKFIVANSRFLTQKAYGIASIADELYMHPQGYFDFKGFSSQTTFIKGTLDKLGIEPMIFYAGKFKSATEPLRRTNMSEESKLQTKEFLEDIYQNYLESIAANRSLPVSDLRDIADNYKIKSVQDAVDFKLIDGLRYDDEVFQLLKEKIGFEEDEDLELISLKDYSDSKEISAKGKNTGDNRIAIVYAEGSINMGDDTKPNEINGDAYAKIIRKLRKNDKVKAVVLRVNSPGGSAFASDLIWRELELLKKEKPFVVSMGNLAASGGYYISTNADKIYAEKNTITGSIGVFGVVLNMNKFLDNKLGITTDYVNTGKYSDFPNLTKQWSEEEKAIIQIQIEDIYGDFIGKVAKGRGMSEEQVHEIAQGRVWSGQDALDIGLVDEIGSLEDALEHAKELAEVDEPKISVYPKVKTEWERIQEMFDIEAKANQLVKKKLGEYGEVVNDIETIQTYSEPQMRMPFTFEIN